MSATLKYVINNKIELNYSYMPFIRDGGLFVPTSDSFDLDDCVVVDLKLPDLADSLQIEGKIVWITPVNSLYQILTGIGIQLIGDNAKTNHDLIKANIDNTFDTGGYVYGMGNSIDE